MNDLNDSNETFENQEKQMSDVGDDDYNYNDMDSKSVFSQGQIPSQNHLNQIAESNQYAPLGYSYNAIPTANCIDG
jgi:hypothetical protein